MLYMMIHFNPKEPLSVAMLVTEKIEAEFFLEDYIKYVSKTSNLSKEEAE